MSNSSLVNYTLISPNRGQRTHKIDTITIHHMACNLSIEACGAGFAARSRNASSNYGIGTDGRIGMYVEEKDRSFCSSNYENDNRAITIEVANDGKGPDWHVSDLALEATIKLCTDICKRNNIKKLNFTGDKTGNLTMHKWFAYTACPGPYLESKFPYIAEEVNRRLGVENSKDEDKNSSSTSNSQKELKVGDIIELIPGAVYTTGKKIPDWLYQKTLYARNIDGNNVTFSYYKTGPLTGIVSKKYIVGNNDDNKSENNSSVSSQTKPVVNSSFSIGDEVRLVQGATYHDGKRMPSWLFTMPLYVRNIGGDIIVFSTLKTGAVTGMVNKKYLQKVNKQEENSASKPVITDKKSLAVGDKIRLKAGSKYYNGKSIPAWAFNRDLYVRAISGDRIAFSIYSSGAITGDTHISNLEKI